MWENMMRTRETSQRNQKRSGMNTLQMAGNQAVLQRMCNIIQKKKLQITSDKLDYLEGKHFADKVTADYDELVEKLKKIKVLDESADYEVIDSGAIADGAYGAHEAQYLSPSKLRTALNANGDGGEAHHIIPSCIAEKNSWDRDEFNKSWNGIMLPGSMKESKVINALKKPKQLPFHRKNNIYDHPEYTAKIRSKIVGKSQSDMPKIASDVLTTIEGMLPGTFIDDM